MQDGFINNNRFINVQYIQPGKVRAVKDEAKTAILSTIGKGLIVFFQNNYFERITDVRNTSFIVFIHANSTCKTLDVYSG